MKLIKKIACAIVTFALIVCLVACSSSTKSYADKINKKAEAKEYISYTDAKKELGDGCIDITFLGEGFLIAAEGIDSLEDFEKLTEEDEKDIKGIIIVVQDGNCIRAVYGSGEELAKAFED